MKSLAPLLLLAACAGARKEPEESPVSRAEAVAALYKQLDLVLDRHDTLAKSSDPADREECASLLRLAGEIVMRIVRIDPQADVPKLVERVEAQR